MSFQQTVRLVQAIGIAGQVIFDGPQRAEPNILKTVDPANNVIGRAFTAVAANQGEVVAGGSGDFAGILIDSLIYASGGTAAGGSLAPTVVLPNELTAEFLKMGTVIAALLNAANIGDNVAYATADGQLSAVAPVAAFTASQATTVLTVSAITAGVLGVGSTVKNAAGEVIGEIISLGTGTGGTGTYNLNTSATVASAAMTANSVAGVGKAFIPNTKVVRQNIPSAGLAFIQLTN
jgi:hypothetical protein